VSGAPVKSSSRVSIQRRGISLVDRGPGRALFATESGRMYIGRGYSIWSSDDDGAHWQSETSLPAPWKRRLGGVGRIAARLLRYEIRALGVLSDGGLVAANRDWMYFSRPGEPMSSPSRIEEAGQAVKLPMTLTVGPGDQLVWGEYNAQTGHGTPVRLYASTDVGRSFEIVHTFEARSILHVHSLLFDPLYDHYWVFCGDYDEEPGIGVLSRDLERFDWFCKGEQRFRACEAFDFGDRLVYATDTPLATNEVLSLDKKTGKLETLRSVQGSCLYAARFGDVCAFSTTVEPGAFDGHETPSLWISRDGDHFEEVLVTQKDRWPHLLQFGSLVLPRGHSGRENLFFSGQAVKQLDGRLMVGTLEPTAAKD